MDYRKKKKLLSLIKQYKISTNKKLRQNYEFKERSMKDLVHIGFSQKKYAGVTIWKYANSLMLRGEQLGICYPYNYGRGKGQWTTPKGITINDVTKKLTSDGKAKQILAQYNKYVNNAELKYIQKNKIPSKGLPIQKFIMLGFEDKRFVDKNVWKLVNEVMKIAQKLKLVYKEPILSITQWWTVGGKYKSDVVRQLIDRQDVKKIYAKYK